MGARAGALLSAGASLAVMAFALSACGVPAPSPSSAASPSASPSATAASTDSPAPDSLHVDGMATVVAGGLREIGDPASPSATANPGAHLATFASGQQLFIVGGPNGQTGVDFWQVADTAFPDRQKEFGWVPAKVLGKPAIEPFIPPCPPKEELDAQTIANLGGLAALACFGSEQLDFSGELACRQVVSNYSSVGGAPYLDGTRTCAVDEVLPAFGKTATSILNVDPRPAVVRGNYDITGHFDDPGAATCGYIAFGARLDIPQTGDPWPVLACRTLFVVTALAPLD